jgi:hypothetical protein
MSAPDRGGDDAADPVARNRATPRRRTPGRLPVGAEVTRRLGLLVATLMVGATLLLATLLLRSA